MDRDEMCFAGPLTTVVAVGETGARALRAVPDLPYQEPLPSVVHTVLLASAAMVLETNRCASARMILGPNPSDHDAAVFQRVLGRPDVVVLVTAQCDAPLAAAVAHLAHREHVLVVAIVAGGFASVNPALTELELEADAVIEIQSGVDGADVGLGAAGSSLERIMASAVHGLIAPLTYHGFIGWDLEDLRVVMRRPGRGRVGLGWGHGVRGAEEAARRTIASPALAGSLLKDAAAIFLAFIVGEAGTLADINDAATIIQEASHEETNMVFATVVEPRVVDEMRVVLYAVGRREGAA